MGETNSDGAVIFMEIGKRWVIAPEMFARDAGLDASDFAQ